MGEIAGFFLQNFCQVSCDSISNLYALVLDFEKMYGALGRERYFRGMLSGQKSN